MIMHYLFLLFLREEEAYNSMYGARYSLDKLSECRWGIKVKRKRIGRSADDNTGNAK
jgi:hypothetical protein